MLPTLRLWLARKLCPPTHVVVLAPAATSAHQENILAQGEARMNAAVYDGFPPDPAWVEAWNGRAR